MLRVTATSTDGKVSDRLASDHTVHGVRGPGALWAMQARREGSTNLARQSVCTFHESREDAQEVADDRNRRADEGKPVEDQAGHQYYDAQVVEGFAYLAEKHRPA
jgi:hypothetical protein